MIENQENLSGMEDFLGPVISSYSRRQAIEDGVLVDLSTLLPSDTRIYKWSAACTSSVWGIIERACPREEKGGDIELRDAGPWVWDLCWMSVKAKTKILSPSQHLFACTIGRKTYHFKAVCGPGDELEPVITIMLPDED
jgi:hypothetical protein